MAQTRITKKSIGKTVKFMGRDDVITGKIVAVRNGIATIEHGIQSNFGTYTDYLATNGDRIIEII